MCVNPARDCIFIAATTLLRPKAPAGRHRFAQYREDAIPPCIWSLVCHSEFGDFHSHDLCPKNTLALRRCHLAGWNWPQRRHTEDPDHVECPGGFEVERLACAGPGEHALHRTSRRA